jgi:hypothetical protein
VADDIGAPPKARGRPPKEIAPLTTVGDMLTPEEAAELRRRLLSIAAVANLPGLARDKLIGRIEHEVPWVQVITGARQRSPKGKPGNRHKSEIPPLLVACMRAWREATGTDARIWQDHDGGEGEAIAITVAREALGIARGLPVSYAGDLRRQIKIAKQSWVDEFKK